MKYVENISYVIFSVQNFLSEGKYSEEEDFYYFIVNDNKLRQF